MISKVLLASLLILSITTGLCANTQQIQLTPQERGWLKQNPNIKLATLSNQPPISMEDSQGKHIGILADIFTHLINTIDHELKHELVKNAQEMHTHSKDKGIYGASIILNTPRHKNEYLLSDPYMLTPFYIFTKKNSLSTIKQANDLKGKKVAIPRGHRALAEYLDKIGGVKKVIVDSPLEQMQKVISGEVDAMIGYITYPSLINKYLMADLVMAFIAKSDQTLHIGVNPEHPILLSILNKAIATISPQQKQDILAKWTKISRDDSAQIEFTDKEKRYLAQKGRLKYCFSPEWKPYDYLENGKHKGIYSDYIKLFKRRLGLTLEPWMSESWVISYQDAIDRKCDFYSGLVHRKEREKYFSFTKPYYEITSVLVGGSDKQFVSSINSIIDKPIGATAHSALAAQLKNNYSGINLIEYNSRVEQMNAVETGKAFAVALNLEEASLYIKESGGNLKVIAKVTEAYPISVAVRNDEPELLSIFEKLVDSITQTEHNTIAKKWNMVTITEEVDRSLIWKILSVAALIFLGILYWNRTLQREIMQRRIAEKLAEEANYKLKGNQKELEQARDIADKANQTKSIFLANMSHEIRTPMNAVLGFSELLIKTELNDEQKNYVLKTLNAADTLLILLNDILDLSKIEAGKLKISNNLFNPSDIFKQSIDLLLLDAKQKGISLEYEIDENIPKHLLGDSLRIRQIIINLLSNAVKFTEKGSVYVSLFLIHQDTKRCSVEFAVTDTGIGISQEDQENLFEHFTQVDNSATHKEAGTGLGLAICKQLTEVMGGSIEVESKQGQGSTFSFSLTLSIPEASVLPAKSEDHSFDFNDLNILLVEDNDDNRDVARGLLTHMGANVNEANNGKEALEMIKAKAYDIVLMDIQMPEMDGLSVTRALREDGFTDLPIIAVSAHASQDEQNRSLNAGMNAHLNKPFSIKELQNILLHYFPDKVVKETELAFSQKLCWADELPETPGLVLSDELCDYWLKKEDFLQKLEPFIQNLRIESERLHTLMDEQDFPAAEKLLHKLKGGVKLFGADRLNESIEDLLDALNGQIDIDTTTITYQFDEAVSQLCGLNT